MKQLNVSRRSALKMFGAGASAFVLSACGSKGQAAATAAATEAASTAAAEDSVVVRVGSLSGPTTIGLLDMMKDTTGIPTTGTPATPAASGQGIEYSYSLFSAPDELLPLIVQGEVDIALIPSNTASVLYNKMEGNLQVIDVNTLGVLSVVTGDTTIKSFEDLAGHTVYMSGQGASPEYTLNYLLERAGIADKVSIEWQSEHAAVASVLASDPSAIGVLPQPFTTATLAKNSSLLAPISLTDVWKQYAEDSSSQFVMGVSVVNAEFAKAHPSAVEDFLKRHAASVKQVNDDPASAAELVVEAGILPKAQIAEKAIPACNVVCETGDEMKNALAGYLQVLFNADAKSVGGALPKDDFYYGVA